MDYIFGYGSIIEDSSRLSTLRAIRTDSVPHTPLDSPHCCDANDLEVFTGGHCTDDTAFGARIVGIAGVFNRKRAWVFRSTSGFTALGLFSVDCQPSAVAVFGVLFPVDSVAALVAFDAREKGYHREQVPLTALVVDASLGCPSAQNRATAFKELISNGEAEMGGIPRVWAYIPNDEYALAPNEEHPILQTYVDVCVRGCLAWGGRGLASEFIGSTSGWSPFYLNDAPMSRRPWLHRQDYARIDECLERMSVTCLYGERRHPEEYSAEHLSPLKGLWGVPPRNIQFVGRSAVMGELERNIIANGSVTADDIMTAGSYQVGLVGLGGVGKTQTAVEFAHRQFAVGRFGLIMWLRATKAEDVAADMRRFAFDSGILRISGSGRTAKNGTSGLVEDATCSIDFDDDQIAEEVRRKLTRSRCNWLVVLDNVEDASVLAQYNRFLQPEARVWHRTPDSIFKGAADVVYRGHILVTSRILVPEWERGGSVVILDCFNAEESVHYIHNCLGLSEGAESFGSSSHDGRMEASRILGRHLDASSRVIYVDLAMRMGFLPLALSMATAYMRRCDVDVVEYVKRLDDLDRRNKCRSVKRRGSPALNWGGIAKVNESIVSSLNISLDRIRVESEAAAKLVPCLGFLYPDNITKSFIGALVVSIDSNNLVLQARKHISSLLVANKFAELEPNLLNAAHTFPTFIHALIKDKRLLATFLRRLLLQGRQVASICVIVLAALLISVGSDGIYFYRMKLFFICFVLFVLFIAYAFISFIATMRYQELLFTYERLGIIDTIVVENSQTMSSKDWLMKLIPALDATFSILDVSFARSPCCVAIVPDDMSEYIAAERDSVWELMIQFSVMTVRGTRSMQRIGSIHRLQQNVIQNQSSDADVARCLEHCVHACCRLWNFDGRNLDFSAWDSCGQLLPHLDVLSRHIMNFLNVESVVKRLTSSGALLQKDALTIINEFQSQQIGKNESNNKSKNSTNVYRLAQTGYFAQSCGRDCFSIIKELVSNPQSGNSDRDDQMDLSITNIQSPSQDGPFSAHSIRWRYILDLSELCMQAGLYASVVQSKFDSAQSFLDMALALVNYLGWALNNSQSSIRRNFPNGEMLLYVQTSSAILYHLGKTLRYNGLFERSKNALSMSLNIRQRQSPVSFEVSDSLHELGVLNLKLHRLADAEVLLTMSLRLKKQLNSVLSLQSNAEVASSHLQCDTSEAATLHQLGVVARAQRRYEDAEELLQKSLISSMPAGAKCSISHAGLTSRAATIQQLGRIALRKGHLVRAQALFNEALELYEVAYGEVHSSTHINTIAVRHQLGNTAVANRRFSDACKYYSACLSALETLYGESVDVWRRYDIVFELQSLGQSHLSNGDSRMAESIFNKQIDIIRTILSVEYSYSVDKHSDSGIGSYHMDDTAIDGSNAIATANGSDNATYLRRRAMLLNSHLFATYFLRNIEKHRGNVSKAAEFSKEAQNVRLIQKQLLCNNYDAATFSSMYSRAVFSLKSTPVSEKMNKLWASKSQNLSFTDTALVKNAAVEVNALEDIESCGITAKSLFRFDCRFKLKPILEQNQYGDDLCALLMKILTELVAWRCTIRSRCAKLTKAIKVYKKFYSNHSKIASGYAVINDSDKVLLVSGARSFSQCVPFSTQMYTNICEYLDSFKLALLVNGNESVFTADQVDDFDRLRVIVSSFHVKMSAEMDTISQNDPLSARSQDQLPCTLLLCSTETRVSFDKLGDIVPTIFNLCDCLRDDVKLIGIIIEDVAK